MKRIIVCLMACLSISLMFNSCSKVDESLLIGKWQEGTVFEKYLSNGTGYTWDTSDNVTEAEAQKFEWTLVNSELTQIHIMESSATRVPKYYTLIELTSTSLKYKDNLNVTHSFVKISK